MQNAIQNQDLPDEMTAQETHDHPLPESTPIATAAQPQSDFKEPTECEATATNSEKREAHNNSGNMFKNDRKRPLHGNQ